MAQARWSPWPATPKLALTKLFQYFSAMHCFQATPLGIDPQPCVNIVNARVYRVPTLADPKRHPCTEQNLQARQQTEHI